MEPLVVEAIEFYPKDNAKKHRTEEYDLVSLSDMPTPVFRRGYNFHIAVGFNRYFDESCDIVRISFGFGPKPNVTKGTRVILPVLIKQRQLPQNIDRWSMSLSRHDGNTLIMLVHIPPNAQVGIWHCSIQTNISGKRDKRVDFKCKDDIYVLFNPWCKDDGVYMDTEDERNEYVMNENGKIWCGTYKHPRGKRWIFGQFDDVVLPASVFLLEKSGLPHVDWGSPILVTRAISQIINSIDEDGLLEGKWDGKYDDGTSPHSWTGSVAILDQYLRSGGRSVKYGQCWVFSAVTVTVCRTLGIPCRSTTNYVSAHDTNCSLTVDKYFDIFGSKIENGPDGDCNDSCWNFHVWNDVWMARPDLPAGYDGWQVIDATPQETSDAIFRCGPASIEAVRKGDVGYLYDTPFVFAEVNADICHFQEDEASDWGFSRLSINQYHVGRKIVTKRVGLDDDKGDSDFSDVTAEFKNPEGTEAERLAVYKAIRGIPRAHQLYDIPDKQEKDVQFDLIEIDAVPFGKNFDVVVNIYNRSDNARNISAILSASAVYYTGTTAHHIKRAQEKFSVKPRDKEVLKIHVSPLDYLDKLVDHSMIKIYAFASVHETNQTWSDEDDFTLTKPYLTIRNEIRLFTGQETKVDFSFLNPLNQRLTGCTYNVEGPGLQKPKVSLFRYVQPNEIVKFSEQFRPQRPGERKIVANFNCNEIQGINGSTTVYVK